MTRMQVELVRTVTRDGLRLDGALVESRPAREGRNATEGVPYSAALLLHGVAGNFYTSSTLEPLVPALTELGLSVLMVNTRGHDSVFGAMLGNVRRRLGAAYETVDECRLDVGAWIDFLTARGHERIAVIGHSLGAIKAIYAQAYEKWPQVAAVVAVSPPRLSYSAFMNAPESSVFFESFSTARQMVQEGRGEDLFTSNFPFPLLITAGGFIDKYGPAERYNILRFVHELSCPALFAYGSKELEQGEIPFAGMPDALRSGPGADRREIVVVDGADHLYSGVTDQLAGAICAWMCGTVV
jgi:pimeloyl-ACP methyl ester carboxylesterase